MNLMSKTQSALHGIFLYACIALSALPAMANAANAADGDYDWNISTNPLGLILGPNLKLEYKVNDHVTAGPGLSLVYFNIGGVKASGASVGVNGTYYFDQVYKTGWFTSAGANLSKFRATYDDKGQENTANITNFSVAGLGGYKWFWGRFNLSLGLGLALNFPSTKDINDSNGNKVKSVPLNTLSGAGDASIGVTF